MPAGVRGNMPVLDYIIIGILGFFAVIGLIRGLVSQLFSIFGLVAGFVLARVYYGNVADYLGLHQYMGGFAAFLLVFIAVFICTRLIGLLVEKILKLTKLSLFNRVCGFLLGFLKGFAICSLIVACMLLIYPEGEKVVKSSPAASYFYRAAEAIYRVVPEGIKGTFKQAESDDVKEETEPPPSSPDRKNPENRF
jgi:membrane protein required for colicin V production